jgi:hypothetical protein
VLKFFFYSKRNPFRHPSVDALASGRPMIPVILAGLLLCSCSPKQDNNVLPQYSDMGAAEDAGKAK